MNPDLAMDAADQKLLKSTGAGNLFMVFGEPDLELRTLPDGKLQVELRGLDVYDPTTGEIRSSVPGDPARDIACWFIDTDYNEESFFVRQPTSPAVSSTGPTRSFSARCGPRSTRRPGQPSMPP
jgi:adenine-specific DNA-methyltransferase